MIRELIDIHNVAEILGLTVEGARQRLIKDISNKKPKAAKLQKVKNGEFKSLYYKDEIEKYKAYCEERKRNKERISIPPPIEAFDNSMAIKFVTGRY